MIGYALDLSADLLNLRALRSDIPDGFRDVYDPERYRRSQEYTRARVRFGFFPTAFHLLVLLAFWFFGGFTWLDGFARSFAWPAVATGLVFIGVLGAAGALLSLPFRWYSTFVIEERFGFNKTTPKTFVTDLLKGAGLTLALGIPLIALILWFFESLGSQAWLWCWAVSTVFSLVVQFVAPTWIFPLFNTFSALESGELRDAVIRYAAKVDFPLSGLFVIDGSRRSTKANAFFTGFGERKRVALFDTLIEGHPTHELVAIVAHEIGHYKKGHIPKRLALSVAQSGVTFYLLSLFLESRALFEAFFVSDLSVYAGLVFFGLLLTPVDLVLSLFSRAMSRKDEFEADAFASDTGFADDLVSALKRLSAKSLANLTPHPMYVLLHHTHPPLIERVAALQRPRTA